MKLAKLAFAAVLIFGFASFGITNPANATSINFLPNGCAAINAGVANTSGPSANTINYQFNAGDKLTFQVSGRNFTVYSHTSGTNVIVGVGPGTYNYTALASDQLSISWFNTIVTATCTVDASGNTLSTVGQTEGLNSLAANNDILDAVITASTGSSFNPISGNANGVAMMVAPGQQDIVAPAADAPHALQSDNPWRLWAAGRYTHASGTETGDQFNGLFGVSRRFGDDKAFGLFGGAETFNYTDATPAQLSGAGGTFGGFVAGQMGPRLALDARAYGTLLNYNITQGGTNGSTSGQRFVGSVTASYELGNGPVSFKPYVRGMVLTETDAAYTDSAAAAHASQSYTNGVVSPGVKLSRAIPMANGATFTPYIGGEADYALGTTILAGFSATQGLSGKVSVGANWLGTKGTLFGLDASYGGIGSTINSETLQATITIPF